MTILSANKLNFSYPGAQDRALKDISLSVEAGQYVAVLGANGSGKSTLARCLNGLLVAPAGALRVFGLDPSLPANRQAVRRQLAMVFQSPPDQIVASVVEEDVAFGLENLGVRREDMLLRVKDALASVGLSAEAKRPPRFLSSGQQQRLAVAGVIAMRPRCVIFDEATSMIDPAGRRDILDILDGLVASGTAVLHITHDMAEAARAVRVLVLSQGRLVFDGTPAELFSRPELDTWSLTLPLAAQAALSLGLSVIPAESAEAFGRRLARHFADSSGSHVPMASEGAAIAGQSGVSDIAPSSAEAKGQPQAFKLKDVGFRYLAGTEGEREALKPVSLSVPSGTALALVGPTGSGKSTLLQLMATLLFPSSGTALHFGTDVRSPAADPRRMRMASPLSVQRPETAIFEFYAGDEVAFGPRNQGYGGAELVRRVRTAMDAVGLPYDSFRDRRARSLSGGEKRRLAIASVLAMEPKALLLDEPTSALDPKSRLAVMDLLLDHCRSRGVTLVYATHSMEEAARADAVAVLNGGELRIHANPARVFCSGWEADWGTGRPFASEAAAAAGISGLRLDACVLDVPALSGALRASA